MQYRVLMDSSDGLSTPVLYDIMLFAYENPAWIRGNVTQTSIGTPIALASVRVTRDDGMLLPFTVLSNVDIKAKLTFVDLPDVLWGLNVIIAKSIYNTANPAQTPSLADIWNDNVTVFYMDPNPAIDVMSFAYTFQARPFMTKTWREEARAVEMIEVSEVVTEKIAKVTGLERTETHMAFRVFSSEEMDATYEGFE